MITVSWCRNGTLVCVHLEASVALSQHSPAVPAMHTLNQLASMRVGAVIVIALDLLEFYAEISLRIQPSPHTMYCPDLELKGASMTDEQETVERTCKPRSQHACLCLGKAVGAEVPVICGFRGKRV